MLFAVTIFLFAILSRSLHRISETSLSRISATVKAALSSLCTNKGSCSSKSVGNVNLKSSPTLKDTKLTWFHGLSTGVAVAPVTGKRLALSSAMLVPESLSSVVVFDWSRSIPKVWLLVFWFDIWNRNFWNLRFERITAKLFHVIGTQWNLSLTPLDVRSAPSISEKDVPRNWKMLERRLAVAC